MPSFESLQEFDLGTGLRLQVQGITPTKTNRPLPWVKRLFTLDFSVFVKKFTVVQSIVPGTNTITHNLNLTDPKGFAIKVLDSSNNLISISNYTAFTATSFSFNSAVNITNCHFTII